MIIKPQKKQVKQYINIMTLEQEIQESIKKNLPLQVGEALKKRLEEADKDKESLKSFAVLNNNQAKKIKQLEETIDKHNSITNREQALKAREEILKEAETKLEVKTLTYQLETEKEKVQFTKEVAMGLVRNTVFKKSIFDSEIQTPYNMPNNMGGTTMVYPTPVNKSLNETQTEE